MDNLLLPRRAALEDKENIMNTVEPIEETPSSTFLPKNMQSFDVGFWHSMR